MYVVTEKQKKAMKAAELAQALKKQGVHSDMGLCITKAAKRLGIDYLDVVDELNARKRIKAAIEREEEIARQLGIKV